MALVCICLPALTPQRSLCVPGLARTNTKHEGVRLSVCPRINATVCAILPSSKKGLRICGARLERVQVRGGRQLVLSKRGESWVFVIIFTGFDPEQPLLDTCWPLAPSEG